MDFTLDGNKVASAAVYMYESLPNKAIHTMSFHIGIDYENPLHIGVLPYLLIGDDSILDYFWREAQFTHRIEDAFSLVIQIEGTRIDELDNEKLLRKVTVTSDVYAMHPSMLNFREVFVEHVTNQIHKAGETEYYRFYVNDYGVVTITRIVVTRIFRTPGGGCKTAFHVAPLPKSFTRDGLYDPEIENNLCFYACVSRHLFGNVNDQIIYDYSRNTRPLYTDFTGLVNFEEIKSYCGQTGTAVTVWEVEEVVNKAYSHQFKKSLVCPGDGGEANILLHRGHYQLILNINITHHLKCKSCMKWRSATSTKHWETCVLCDRCKKKKGKGHRCAEATPRKKKPRSLTVNKRLKTDVYTCDKNVWFADLETFMDGDKMVVYSAALVGIEHLLDYDNSPVDMEQVECEQFYGQQGFNVFCNRILQLKGTVVFYNGSRFDLYFILKWLVERQEPIKTFLRDDKSNRILSLQVRNVRFWDLCLFTMGSLSQACRDLKVPEVYCKKDFDHTLITDWDRVREHRSMVVEYNKYDVVSLGIAYCNFARTIFNLYKFNCIEAISLSNMAYEIWRTHYVNKNYLRKIILPSTEEYSFMRRALFGGRCCPQRMLYVSSQYDGYQAGLISFNQVNDYLVYLDVVSLYPYSCLIGKFPCGRSNWLPPSAFYTFQYYLNELYPTGRRCLSTENELERSFLEVDVDCPTHLLTPFLFCKGGKGELVQNLLPKIKQVYDGNTLIEASRLGYRITRIYSVLQYAELSNTLDQYMTHVFSQKNASAKGSIDYACHKYLMNGLTGKFNQIKRDLEWMVVYDDSIITSCLNEVKKFEWLLDEQSNIKGALVGVESITEPTKPLQYGVNILSSSRILMSLYTDFIGGYTQEANASYYGDTDSMILHSHAYLEARMRVGSEAVFGDDFGKLSEEWKNSKILRAVFIAPKTYILEIVKSDGKRVWHFAAKGIPQSVKEIDVEEYYEKYDFDVEDKVNSLKTVVYTLLDPEYNVISTRSCLNWEFFESMTRGYMVVCSFGTLKRRLADASRGNVCTSIELKYDQFRTINEDSWWLKNKRSCHLTKMTYPKGHILNK